MRTTLLRLLALTLLLAMLLPLVVACGGDDEETTAPTVTTTAGPITTVPVTTTPPVVTTLPVITTAPVVTTEPTVTSGPVVTTAPVTTAPPVEIVTPDGATSNIDLLTFTEISPADLAGYRIVYSELASPAVVAAAEALGAAIAEATGVTLEVVSDRLAFGEIVADAKEIRVGATNRDTAAALRYRDFSIKADGDSLVLAAGGDEAAVAAVNAYIASILTEAVRVPTTEYYYHAAYQLDALYVSGVDISLFTIVRDAENATTAEYLQQRIRDLTGIVLPIALPSAPSTKYEILIGNMTPAGFDLPDAGTCLVEQIGSKLFLGGKGAYAGYYATLAFLDAAFAGEISGAANVLVGRYTEEHLVGTLFKLNLSEELGDMTGIYEGRYDTDYVMARFLAAKAELPEEVTVLDRFDVNDYPFSLQNQVFVSPDGDDSNDGSLEAPFATLDRAVSEMANDRGGVIWMMGGTYEVNEMTKIQPAASGTSTSPLIIKAYNGEQVTMTANKTLDTSEEKWHYFDPEDNEDLWERVPEEARDYILWTTLEEQGWEDEDIAEISTKTGPPKLYMDGAELSLARYPNSDAPLDLLYFTNVYDTGRVTSRDGSDLYWPWVARATSMQPDGIQTAIGWEIQVLDGYLNGGKNQFGDWTEQAEQANAMAEEILSWVNTGDIWYYGSTFEGWEFNHYNLALELTEAGMTTVWAHYEDANGNGRLDDGEDINGNGELDDTPYLGYPRAFKGDDKGRYGNDAQSYMKTDGIMHPDLDEGGTYYSLKSTTPNSWGAKHSTNSPAGRNTFYLYNAIEALDAPGEWFLDRDTGRLYLYPEGELLTDEMAEHNFSFSNPESFNVLHLDRVSNVIVDGITVNGATNCGIYVTSCSNVVLQDITVTNTQSSNVYINATKNSAVIYSDFSAAYNAMLQVSDTAATYSLTPGDVIVQNNFFHGAIPSKQVAISCGGCRTIISHNYFKETTCHGNTATECIVEYNRFDGGSYDVVDGGMVYFGGWACRSNHYRYNLFHMFNATHNAVYNDTMASGNYTYHNVVSTIGSKSNSNKGWYSSTGMANVCFGNIMVLRTPQQVVAAKSVAGDEGDATKAQYTADSVNESNLFYYHFGDEWGAGYRPASYEVPGFITFTENAATKKRYYYFEDYDGNPQYKTDENGNAITQDSGVGGALVNGFAAGSQALAGHWWEGIKDLETKSRLETCDTEAWYRRNPEYIDLLWGTRLLRAVQEDANEDYEIRYFYVPWHLTGKDFTYSGLPAGTVLTIPAYEYLEDDGDGSYKTNIKKTTEVEYITVDESGTVTLTYEQLGAMERMRRQPALCIIANNVLLGGTPIYESYTDANGFKVPTEVSDPIQVMTDNNRTCHGYVATAYKTNNYMHYYYPEIMPYVDDFDYYMDEEAWAAIMAAGAEDPSLTIEEAWLDDLQAIDYERAGLTFEFDYDEWFNDGYELGMGWLEWADLVE